ncbi:MAG: hypothetical protein PVF83_15040 [Anaerolineales bacterium]|jgi:hypothetical protein
MLKKIIIGILAFTVIGAGGAALVNQAINPADTETDSTPVVASVDTKTQQSETAITSQEFLGTPWQDEGIITGLDDYGLDLTLESGTTLYVELGPPDYWQAQDTQLELGLQVTIEGTENEGMVHANQVTLADGRVLQLRTESGQPLWNGSAANGEMADNTSTDKAHTPEPQAQVDDWVTINGTLIAYQRGSMTVSTAEGRLISFQTGQPRFFAEQGVTFAVGDEVIVLGFYQDGQFLAGDITQVSTGLRVMLRDPNGRPLWAGPGNGNGQGNGNGKQ